MADLEQVRVYTALKINADDKVADPASDLIREELRELLDGILRGLPERERIIIESRFSRDGDSPETLGRLGKRLCLSKERVRMLEKKALGSLRKTLVERGVDIRDFLAV